MRGESYIRSPPTPNFNIGSETEYTLDEGEEVPNTNNNAKDDSDSAESDEEQNQELTSKKTKMDTAKPTNKKVCSISSKKS